MHESISFINCKIILLMKDYNTFYEKKYKMIVLANFTSYNESNHKS